MARSHLAMVFQHFGEVECKNISPLYESLSLKIANDSEMLELSSHAHAGQPVPNLLFASVQYLLLKGEKHPLKRFYPFLTEDFKKPEDAFRDFKDFCSTYRSDIIALLLKRNVQTNEVRRCAYLYPVFSSIYHKVSRPLALIEIGTSAGLQLMWDSYSYSYGDGKIYGNKSSSLHLETEIKSGKPAILYRKSPPVNSRVGIDLHICDVTNNDELLWLKALIWPEHRNRLKILNQAVEEFKKKQPTLIEGDGINLLPELVEDLPVESALCIFHTHVANQLTKEKKKELLEIVANIAKKRDVFHIYNNIWDGKLHLDSFLGGEVRNEIIGDTDGHGRWFHWELD